MALSIRRRVLSEPVNLRDKFSLFSDYRCEAAYQLARDACVLQAEALFIPCTDFEAIDRIEVLEREHGVPVVTANEATNVARSPPERVVDLLPRSGKLYTLPDLIEDKVSLP